LDHGVCIVAHQCQAAKALGKNNLNNCSCGLTQLQLLYAMSV